MKSKAEIASDALKILDAIRNIPNIPPQNSRFMIGDPNYNNTLYRNNILFSARNAMSLVSQHNVVTEPEVISAGDDFNEMLIHRNNKDPITSDDIDLLLTTIDIYISALDSVK